MDVVVRKKPSLIRRHGPRKVVAMWRSEAQLIPTGKSKCKDVIQGVRGFMRVIKEASVAV